MLNICIYFWTLCIKELIKYASILLFVQDEEVGLLTEVTHLQEIMESLCLQSADPASLPPASEQVIMDLKGADSSTFNFQLNSQVWIEFIQAVFNAIFLIGNLVFRYFKCVGSLLCPHRVKHIVAALSVRPSRKIVSQITKTTISI